MALEGGHEDVAFPATVSDDEGRVLTEVLIEHEGHGATAGAVGDVLGKVTAVVEPVGAVNVDDLDVFGFDAHATDGEGMVADEGALAEELECLSEHVVEVGGEDGVGDGAVEDEMREAEVGFGDGDVLHLSAEIGLELSCGWIGVADPVGVGE